MAGATRQLDSQAARLSVDCPPNVAAAEVMGNHGVAETRRDNEIIGKIIAVAIEVRRELEPGLQEPACEPCLPYGLSLRRLGISRHLIIDLLEALRTPVRFADQFPSGRLEMRHPTSGQQRHTVLRVSVSRRVISASAMKSQRYRGASDGDLLRRGRERRSECVVFRRRPGHRSCRRCPTLGSARSPGRCRYRAAGGRGRPARGRRGPRGAGPWRGGRSRSERLRWRGSRVRRWRRVPCRP